ncbi:hypothetical protein [Clostridium sp. C8-1-8]|uniref:hypothetical protein n=1 Tax=Clostridium sp. C8-1-8 TaxID=2698831 RepID=UPI00136E7B80|nr:hypothetical protein [Clostridium sp. C8-1-8]
MKRKVIISTLFIIALSIPTVAYGVGENSKDNNIKSYTYEERNNKEHHHKVDGHITNHKYKALLEVEGLNNDNKKAMEAALDKRAKLREQFVTATKGKDKEKIGFDEFKKEAKAIRDKVINKEITEEEGKKQFEELQVKKREASEIWNSLSEKGKKDIEALEKESKAIREDDRKYFEEYRKAVESKDSNSLNTSAKHIIKAINRQNELMEKKIDIIKKEMK